MATTKNDTDWYVQSRLEGGWEVVKEGHQRASAVTDRKVDAVNHAREIVNNLGGGDVQIKNVDNHFIKSAKQGRRKESPAKDRR